jgi:hypothetical protein
MEEVFRREVPGSWLRVRRMTLQASTGVFYIAVTAHTESATSTLDPKA